MTGRPKHGARRARLAAIAKGENPPPFGKQARLLAAQAPQKYVIAMVIGRPKPAAPPLIGPIPGNADTQIEYLGLPQDIYYRLKRLGINTVGDIQDRIEKIPGIATKRRGVIAASLPVGFTCGFPAA